VFLRSLTLRGFKSFAEKTELTFEPGITVIVGPNGSGKSNVVDALTWVLGSHSAKTLRGGSMSDVIFAGSRGRPGLGRAAVDITIDNTVPNGPGDEGAPRPAARLPIEFSEVTVSRSMFATGENDYAINSVACRLLDVQELLSDTGLGRENHTIVGQGQLDAILNSRPEDRRAFIEEAAGILKHRRRKERAVRKLAQMDAHVERLTDVLRELRRNLRPLERQAEAAAKHAELQTQLREVRTIRALRTLDELTTRWDADEAGAARSDTQLQQLEAQLRTARASETAIEQVLADLEPKAEQVGQTHFRLANQAERFRGLGERIHERRRGLLEAVEEPVAGRDPLELRAQAEADQKAAARVEVQRQAARDALNSAVAARQLAEQRRRAHEQAAAAEARRRTEARERRLRWEAEVSALRSTLAQAAAEEGRLAYGDVAAWLLHRLARVHLTDVGNAGRSLLCSLGELDWDDELLELFGIPRALLPPVVDSDQIDAVAAIGAAGAAGAEVPVRAVAGDQQASLFGLRCWKPGAAKVTLGTGAFVLAQAGQAPPRPPAGVIASCAWRRESTTSYALEGFIPTAGSALDWFARIGALPAGRELDVLLRSAGTGDPGVVCVPALQGFGSPTWDAGAHGALLGLSLGTTRGDLARAVVDGILHQVADAVEAMGDAVTLDALWVDGGLSRSDRIVQRLADLAGVRVQRTARSDSTALGAATLAGLAAGVWDRPEALPEFPLDLVAEPELAVSQRTLERERWAAARGLTASWR